MKKLFITILFLLASAFTAYAQTVTLNTHFNAPFGGYDRLRLFPQDPDPVVCDNSAEGIMYYNSVLHNLKVCRGATVGLWQAVAPWSQDSNNNYIYPTDTDIKLNLRIGIRTKTPEFMLTLLGHLATPPDGGILATGIFGTSRTLATAGAGTRFIWHPRKAAMRAGYVSGAQWNDANIGNYSFATGQDCTASGANSTAMGFETIASTTGSVALGYQTTSQGTHTTALGSGTTATGLYATAMGRDTNAGGDYSTAMGDQSNASGNYSTAMGASTTASGPYSTAMGYGTIASVNASTAMGQATLASGLYSTAMGFQTQATGEASTAMGYQSQATGEASTAMGDRTIASGDWSTAIGQRIEAQGNYSLGIALNDQAGAVIPNAGKMCIMGGNVGIDELAPTERLVVNGDVLIRGAITIVNPNSGPLNFEWNAGSIPAERGYYATLAP